MGDGSILTGNSKAGWRVYPQRKDGRAARDPTLNLLTVWGAENLRRGLGWLCW
jgi:hypothetical protein